MQEAHSLPSDDELNRAVLQHHVAAPGVARPVVASEASDPLGGRAEGCPLDVHNRMLGLLAKNAIPRTTQQMRSKQKLTAGESYKVPDTLREALHWGYINPNLPKVPGFDWKRRGMGYQLAPRGG